MEATPPSESMTLQRSADELGVHYMTAYRYVRTGRLPAEKAGGQWRVARSDLAAFIRASEAAPDRRHPTGNKAASSTALMHRLIANDATGSWQLCEAALASGFTPERVYRELLVPALRDIGDLWSRGEVTVAEEHLASTAARRIIGRLGPSFGRRGRRRGTIIVGSAAGDMHALPSALFADLLRARSFDAIDLGSDTPGECFAEIADAFDDVIAVGIVVSASNALSEARITIASARAAGLRAPILAGGSAISSSAEALALGADHGSTSTDDALATFDRLAAVRHPAETVVEQRD